MAASAARRWASSASRCEAPRKRRWYSASALSISLFFGSSATPSMTPRRSAAFRLATRKSRMPCSAMSRAASWASARRRFSTRAVSLRAHRVSEDRLAARLAFRALRQRSGVPRGQVIRHEDFRNVVGILGAHQRAGLRRDPQRDQAVGHAAGLLGHPLERLAHELHPDRQRGARALLRLPERPLLIEADPHGGDEISREAVEPGVPGLVGGAGLARA